MTDADIEATKAPLMDHIVELRSRLVKALAAFLLTFIVCFFFAKDLYNVLVIPYSNIAGPDARLIYTAPQEYFFTQIRVAFFAAAYLSCPVVFHPDLRLRRAGPLQARAQRLSALPLRDAGVLPVRRLARLLHRHAEPAPLLHRYGAAQAAGQGADRVAAAGQRISLARHVAHLRLRPDVPVCRSF